MDMVIIVYTIKENTKYIKEEKKSSFIALLYKVDSIDDVTKYLSLVKDEYKDATHYCYGYIVGESSKFSDDGEPGGTAGAPIMNVLVKNNLTNVLCIVVRYFGGIKLGTGGLVRAYTKACSNVINSDNLVGLIPGYLVFVKVSYDRQKELELLIKDLEYKKEFGEDVIYTIKCSLDILEKIKVLNFDYEKKDKLLIEKRF